MADIQLSVPYHNVVTREGRLLAWALWPLWAILAPLCIIVTLAAIAAYPAIFAPTVTAMLIAIPAVTIVFGALWTAIAQDDKLHISKEGLFFPRILMPRLGFHQYVPWDRLVAADVDGMQPGAKKLRLVIKGCGAVDVDLSGIDEEEVEQLLLAVEVWADRCERTPLLIAYQHEVQNANKGLERASYTQMWEQELSRRFNTTAFIPLEPGASLHQGKLKVVRQLSFGGFSAIYLVKDDSGGFMVAKEAVVPPSAEEKHRIKAEEHFAREAALLTRIQHKGIARVFDHFSENGRNYILLEYIEGQNLRQSVNQNGVPDAATAQRWALEVAAVLDFLHSQSPPIIHRDISPDNIMLRADGSLVIIDFGAANQLVSAATGTLVGKQAYMPPEQLRGKAVVESDYYSFGGTLHFLLTGSDPVPLSVSRPRTIDKSIDERFDSLIAQLTAFEAAERRGGSQSLTQAVKEKFGTIGAAS
jgi:predicted Ser/Thr protein kinase